jgi:hypothetical protein
MLTLHPKPSDDRDASAPRLPLRVVFYPTHVDAVLHPAKRTQALTLPKRYKTLGDVMTRYQASASELLGEAFGRPQLLGLLAESEAAGDVDNARLCRLALAGNGPALEELAEEHLITKIDAVTL